MELTQLRYFYEAARREHITQAANALGIAQPAITLSIRKLEDEIGVKLFRRCGRGVVLTECGKHLYNKLCPILDTLDALPDDLRHIATFEHDTINISLLAASTLMSDIIIDYRKHNPDVTFRISQQPGIGGSDIVVRTEPGRVNAEDEDSFVCCEKIFVAVPASSELAKNGDSIRLEQLKGAGFISLTGLRNFRNMCDSFCTNAGFSPKIIFESDNPYTVKNMIASGMGVGFWPEFSWGKIVGDDVKLLEVSYPECSRTLIIEKVGNRDSDVIDKFYTYLQKSLKKYN